MKAVKSTRTPTAIAKDRVETDVFSWPSKLLAEGRRREDVWDGGLGSEKTSWTYPIDLNPFMLKRKVSEITGAINNN